MISLRAVLGPGLFNVCIKDNSRIAGSSAPSAGLLRLQKLNSAGDREGQVAIQRSRGPHKVQQGQVLVAASRTGCNPRHE